LLPVTSEEKVGLLLEKNEIKIWYGQVKGEDSFYQSYWHVLDDAEKNQANKMHSPLLHKRYVEIHGRTRQLLSKTLNLAPEKITIKKAEHGKPYLVDYPELAFNLSHSAEKMIMAFAWNCRIGVDIEIIKQRVNVIGLVNKCFGVEEITYWNQLPDTEKNQVFYRFWTRKEAFVKATGEGILLGLNHCVINPENPKEFLRIPNQCGKPSEWHLQDIDLDGGVCSAIVTDKLFTDIKLIGLKDEVGI
jgi:4'-phosphopantetheinyl transferase